MTVHEYQCHVRFSDVDVYGHVNNVKYLEYYQEARVHLLHRIRAAERGHLESVVARIDVDYHRPILFRTAPYVVATHVSRIGTSSYTLESEIRDAVDSDAVLSRARAVMVAYDLTAQAPRSLTEAERAILDRWQPAAD